MASPLIEALPREDPESPPAVTVRVRLLAGAGRAEVAGTSESSLLVRVAAPPRAAVANAEVRRVLAEVFGVDLESVELRNGETRADKLLAVSGLEEEQARRLLAAALGRRAARAGRASRRTGP